MIFAAAARLGAQPVVPVDTVVAPASFDARRLSVAGLRVGGSARHFATTLMRLFGKADRVSRRQDWYPGYAAALEVNAKGCATVPGRRTGGEAGNVCVTAFLDVDDVVREIRIERVFPYIDGETFRTIMIRRYGPASDAKSTAPYALGWGPAVAPALAYDQGGPRTALTAFYQTDDDLPNRSQGAASNIRITLQLIDASWASTAK